MANEKPSFDQKAPDGNGRSPSLSSGSRYVENHNPKRDEHASTRKASVAALLRNPLTGMSEEEILADVDHFVDEKGLHESRGVFRKGALLARVGQRADGFEYVDSLTEEEKAVLRKEITSRWDQPFMLYFLVILCAGSAIVQGMDQTAVNGAQVRSKFQTICPFQNTNIHRSSISRSLALPTNGSKGF